jgi:hypothetical protein
MLVGCLGLLRRTPLSTVYCARTTMMRLAHCHALKRQAYWAQRQSSVLWSVGPARLSTLLAVRPSVVVLSSAPGVLRGVCCSLPHRAAGSSAPTTMPSSKVDGAFNCVQVLLAQIRVSKSLPCFPTSPAASLPFPFHTSPHPVHLHRSKAKGLSYVSRFC